MSIRLTNLWALPSPVALYDFVFGHSHQVDSDGDAQEATSTKWTDCWCRSREDTSQEFEVEREKGAVDVYLITASSATLEAKVAVCLCMHGTNDVKIFHEDGGVTLAELRALAGIKINEN